VNSNAFVAHRGFNCTILRPSLWKMDNTSLLLSIAQVVVGTTVQLLGI